jgi:hypothetical protein
VAGVFEQAARAVQASSAGQANVIGCLRLLRTIDTRLLLESIRGSIPRGNRFGTSYLD